MYICMCECVLTKTFLYSSSHILCMLIKRLWFSTAQSSMHDVFLLWQRRHLSHHSSTLGRVHYCLILSPVLCSNDWQEKPTVFQWWQCRRGALQAALQWDHGAVHWDFDRDLLPVTRLSVWTGCLCQGQDSKIGGYVSSLDSLHSMILYI